MLTRRRALGLLVGGMVPAALRAQEPAADPLRDPAAVGQRRDTLTALDNDPIVIAIERRMRCTCGCTLDIYTCRTTDFTCTFSPALHREVMAMRAEGQEPEQILAAFVPREGEAILMAPPASGFNLAGYVVPATVIVAGGAALLAWVSRRRTAVAGAAGAVSPAAAAQMPIDDDQRAALRRALDEVDD